MKKILFLLTVIISFVSIAGSKSASSVAATMIDTTPTYEMKQYWLVLLFRGTQRNQDTATAARIQKAHMNNIDRLAAEGKIIMAGPMGDKGDLRGIFIM